MVWKILTGVLLAVTVITSVVLMARDDGYR